MTNEVSRTIDAVAFAAADLVTPITVLHSAGRFLLTEMSETDLLRWDVTQAVGAVAAARKSIQDATDRLMLLVAKDAEAQAEMADRSGLTTWERPEPKDEAEEWFPPHSLCTASAPDIAGSCTLLAGHSNDHVNNTGQWF